MWLGHKAQAAEMCPRLQVRSAWHAQASGICGRLFLQVVKRAEAIAAQVQQEVLHQLQMGCVRLDALLQGLHGGVSDEVCALRGVARQHGGRQALRCQKATAPQENMHQLRPNAHQGDKSGKRIDYFLDSNFNIWIWLTSSAIARATSSDATTTMTRKCVRPAGWRRSSARRRPAAGDEASAATTSRRLCRCDAHRAAPMCSKCMASTRMANTRCRWAHGRCASTAIKWPVGRRESILQWSRRRTIPSTMSTRRDWSTAVRQRRGATSMWTIRTPDERTLPSCVWTSATWGLSRTISSFPSRGVSAKRWDQLATATIATWTARKATFLSVWSIRVFPCVRAPCGTRTAVMRSCIEPAG